MIREDLVLAYQTIDNLNKMGVEIPVELLAKMVLLEDRYIKEVVCPELTKYAQGLMKDLRLDCSLKLDYTQKSGVVFDILQSVRKAFEEEQEVSRQENSSSHRHITDYIKLYKTFDFRVVFEDGTVCMGENAGDTMAKAVEKMLDYVKIEDLANVPIKVDNLPLISMRKYTSGKSSFQRLRNGWWINTHMNNEAKKRQLERLANSFKINLKVYLSKTVI